MEVLDANIISVRPEFIGLIDLNKLAVSMQLTKKFRSNSGEERFSELITALVANKIFHNVIFETDKAKIVLKNVREVRVEAENSIIRELSRLK